MKEQQLKRPGKCSVGFRNREVGHGDCPGRGCGAGDGREPKYRRKLEPQPKAVKSPFISLLNLRISVKSLGAYFSSIYK